MKISVIIPSYNKPHSLLLTLYSFCHSNFPMEEFEVIICNDGSDFSLEPIIPVKLPFRVELLKLPHRGRAAARNAGIKAARGEIILFNDDDSLISPEFLSAHWKRQLQLKDTVVLGHRNQLYLSQEQIKSITKEKLLGQFSELVSNTSEDIYTAQTRPYIFRGKCSKHWISSITSNMSVRRECLRLYGGFDEGFKGWGFEDLELGYRLSLHGIVFFDDPLIVNYHLEHMRNRKDMLIEMQSNIQYFFNKYGEAEEISLFWDFFIGKISLQEFDNLTYREISDSKEETYFKLFKKSFLESLTMMKGETRYENISSC